MEGSPGLSGRTKLTAIFGDPVEHSQSPAMHNAAYAALAMECAYAAFHVTPEGLREAVRAISALGILGVNLTVPHKERAAPMMASLSAEARTLGAINCIVNRRGVLRGDNTDARGLEMDLRDLGVELRGETAVIIGAGGAAASAVLACVRLGAGRIIVSNRTESRGKALARRFMKPAASGVRNRKQVIIEARGLDMLVDRAALVSASLVINATPMGLKTGGFARLDYDASHAGCMFYDLIYAAEPTPFLKPALELGRRATDGAGMLVNQGVLAFKLFNGVAPPDGVMRRALMDRLGRPFP